MSLNTLQDVEDWINHRGGLSKGLPRLRARVKAGYLTVSEIELVKEYLANLDTSKLSQQEHQTREARKDALAKTLTEPRTEAKGATAAVAIVAVLAALAAIMMIR